MGRCAAGGCLCTDDLCRNPGNFTQSKQSSDANSPSIINSPVLSFPTVTIASSRLKQPGGDLLLPCGKHYQFTETPTHRSDGGSEQDPTL